MICAACDKLPANSDLDGMWHLQRMDYLDQSPILEEDVSEKRFYWNFQLDLLMINSLGEPIYKDTLTQKDVYKAFGRFDYSGTTLNINKLYLHLDVRDSLVNDASTTLFERYGIMGNADSFFVETIDNKKMILLSDDRRLYFRKF